MRANNTPTTIEQLTEPAVAVSADSALAQSDDVSSRRSRRVRKPTKRYRVGSDDDEGPGVLIQVCRDPDCSMEADLPMIQCTMGP